MKPILNLALALLLVTSFVSAARAQDMTDAPDVASIVRRMKGAMEPSQPSVRIMTVKVNDRGKFTTRWTVGQARGHSNDSDSMLTVVLGPAAARGIAFLTMQKADGVPVSYSYLPAVQRVQEVTSVAGYEPFGGTDFSYGDLGFVRLGGHEKLDGVETHNSVRAYKLELPLHNNPLFAKVVTWIATDTGLFIERDYYDHNDKLYKKERFEKVTTIDHVPTITRIVMEDVQQGTSSEIEVNSVLYNKLAPTELFDPDQISRAADSVLWKNVGH